MRRPAYVRDILPVMGWPSLADPVGVYRRLAEAGGKAAGGH